MWSMYLRHFIIRAFPILCRIILIIKDLLEQFKHQLRFLKAFLCLPLTVGLLVEFFRIEFYRIYRICRILFLVILKTTFLIFKKN